MGWLLFFTAVFNKTISIFLSGSSFLISSACSDHYYQVNVGSSVRHIIDLFPQSGHIQFTQRFPKQNDLALQTIIVDSDRQKFKDRIH